MNTTVHSPLRKVFTNYQRAVKQMITAARMRGPNLYAGHKAEYNYEAAQENLKRAKQRMIDAINESEGQKLCKGQC